MSERKEGWFRIIVLIISGIILSLWGTLIKFLVIIHWFVVIITGKRNKAIAEFSELWNTQFYDFLQYTTFVTNDRPFPFKDLKKKITKFSRK